MDELKLIKKKYGEEMMHLCKRLFPTILEEEGLLYSILNENLYPTKSIADDIIGGYLEPRFMQFVYGFIKKNEALVNVGLDPFKLMKKAGYTLHECKTQEEILSYKKYYAKGEELCTFNDDRLSGYHVFFAVKDNVDSIKREDFTSPDRQDAYSTSVISIQFTRGNINSLSIKSRYNHKVQNPDATYANNLENIIPGLTNSFSDYYNFNINQNTSSTTFLSDRLSCVRASNGKHYRYNTVERNIYYCENNIIVDCDEVIDKYYKNREQYLFMDAFILDLKNKEVLVYDVNNKDSFIDSINIGIKKIEVKNIDKSKEVLIYISQFDKPIRLLLNDHHNIIEYENDYIDIIGDNFLATNRSLKKLSLPNVRKIGNNFLGRNRVIKEINLDNVLEIGNDFLKANNSLRECDLPNVLKIGNSFLHFNADLRKITLDNVREIGNNFLFLNNRLLEIDFPNLLKAGDFFLRFNTVIDYVKLDKLRIVDDFFLYSARFIEEIDFPNLRIAGSNFIACAHELNNVVLPNIKKVDDNFLYFNNSIGNLYIPNLEYLPSGSFTSNRYCRNINLDNLKTIDSSAFLNNDRTKKYLLNKSNVCENKPKVLKLLF